MARAANRLLDEWREELDQYSSEDLRRKSKEKLDETTAHCQRLVDALEAAEQRIAPVLSALRDHVMFIKHNLNSQAIASLQGEVDSVQTNVDDLVAEMKASIEEAASLIRNLESAES